MIIATDDGAFCAFPSSQEAVLASPYEAIVVNIVPALSADKGDSAVDGHNQVIENIITAKGEIQLRS
jgi:hypothetical protein